MSELTNIDFDAILATIKPSVVTPKLKEISNLSNDKKLKRIAQLIIENKVTEYNNSDKVTTRIVEHDGAMTEVRHLNVDALMTGVWPAMSLILLSLSYGEQISIIDAYYPKATQFAAKSFASTFSDTAGTLPQGAIQPQSVQIDPEVSKKLDSSNAGIAMIIAMLGSQGYRTPHPDNVKTQQQNMDELVADAEKELQFHNATDRAKRASKYRDKDL